MTYVLATNTELVRYKPLAADPSAWVEVTHLTRAGKCFKLTSRREYHREAARAHWQLMKAKGFRE